MALLTLQFETRLAPSLRERFDHYQATRRPINWIAIVLLGTLHLLAVYALYLVWQMILDPPPRSEIVKIVALFVGFYIFTGFGITAGYHRLFTHRGYKCRSFIRIALLVGGAMSLEGKAEDWVLMHRRHHKYSDRTRRQLLRDGRDPLAVGFDPHSPYEFTNPLMRFAYSHIGWMLVKNQFIFPTAHDLKRDKWVQRLGNKYVFFSLVVLSFLIPFLVAGWRGLIVAGVLRMVVLLNVTWSINSIMHLWGKRARDIQGREFLADNSRNNRWFGLVSLGESLHNSHHAFASCAYHGWKWYDPDPTKWLIASWGRLRLAWEITTPDPDIVFKDSQIVAPEYLMTA